MLRPSECLRLDAGTDVSVIGCLIIAWHRSIHGIRIQVSVSHFFIEGTHLMNKDDSLMAHLS